MKKSIIIWAIFAGQVLFFPLAAQATVANRQAGLDSLYAIWEDETRPDSIRTFAYKEYIWNGFLFSQPDSAFALAEQLIAFSTEKEYLEGQATGLNLQGISQSVMGDYPKALRYMEQSLTIKRKIGAKRGIAHSLGNIGSIYQQQGDYPKALDYYAKCLNLIEQLEDKKAMAHLLNNTGGIYRSEGDVQKARDCYLRSLGYSEELGDKKGIANALHNIGNIYLLEDDYPKALDHFTRSLTIRKELGDKNRTAYSLNNIGSVYNIQGDYSKALDYYTQSLSIMEKLGDKNGIATSLSSIGINHKEQGDYPKALQYCEKALEIAESIKVLDEQKTACNCLYDTYKAMGNSNRALVYLEKINVINDSLHTNETSKKLQQMEFKKQVYQDSVSTAEKERLVEESHREEVRRKNNTRNIAFGMGGLVLLLAGGLYSRLRYVRKSRALIETERDRSDNLLLNILPEEIAQELKENGKAEARDFDRVSILFTDFKSFTETSAKLSAGELVSEINHCFEAFDHIIEKHKVEKIKTIGDSYMAAGGLPVPTDVSVKNTVLAALEMQDFISSRKAAKNAKGELAFEMRVGIHTGPVVAGIVGIKKFQYDIWGDTVNTASRMESSGEVGKVNISQSTFELIKDDSQFQFEARGKVAAKGKGEVEMYFVKAQ